MPVFGKAQNRLFVSRSYKEGLVDDIYFDLNSLFRKNVGYKKPNNNKTPGPGASFNEEAWNGRMAA
jgi:hypothetical protein